MTYYTVANIDLIFLMVWVGFNQYYGFGIPKLYLNG